MTDIKNEIEAKRFLLLASKYLRQEFSEETGALSEEELAAAVTNDCNFAFAHGFSSELEVMEIIDLLWRLPKNLSKDDEKFAWLFLILESQDMDNELRLQALENGYALYIAAKE